MTGSGICNDLLVNIMPKKTGSSISSFQRAKADNFQQVFASVNTQKSQKVVENNDMNRDAAYVHMQKNYRNIAKTAAAEKNASDGKLEGVEEQDHSQVQTVDEDKTCQAQKAAIIMDQMAEMLGVSIGELGAVLQSLGMQPLDLADPTKTMQIVQQLGEFLHVDSSGKQSLKSLLEGLQKQLDSMMGDADFRSFLQNVDTGILEQKTVRRSDWVAIQNSNITVEVEAASETIEVDQLSEKMQKGLKALEGKLQGNSQWLASYLEQRWKIQLQDIRQQRAEIQNVSTSTDEAGQVENSEAAGNAQLFQAGMLSTQEDGASKENSAIKKVLAESAVLKPESNQEQPATQPIAPTNVQLQGLHETKSFASVMKNIPISRNELINQVVDKAQVLVSGDKSEMVMDLKPDHLGKLTIRLVTERGMVMARITAENQQVKEVLETNLQVLRDAMEKQGMSIQGFSVSVGDQPQQGFQRGEEPWNRQKGNRSGKQAATAGIEETEAASRLESVNPYNREENSINITA